MTGDRRISSETSVLTLLKVLFELSNLEAEDSQQEGYPFRVPNENLIMCLMQGVSTVLVTQSVIHVFRSKFEADLDHNLIPNKINSCYL